MFRILDSADAEWLAIWNGWPEAEVFAHPAYVRLYASQTSRAKCAVYERDGVHILYPFLIRDLVAEGLAEGPAPAFDITSAYGYGGPFVWGGGGRASAAADFWREFSAWSARENVVSEFVRFSLFRESLLPYPGEMELRAQNVVRTLDLDQDGLWKDFEYKVRKNVARARQSGVTVECDPEGRRIDDFLRIYYATMQRREAAARYYFPAGYFENLLDGLRGSLVFFHAVQNGAVISTELALLSKTSMYSFLGGTDERFFEYRPNDLLKYEMILWAKQAGKRQYVLGGGYRGDDGIYRYKRSFAPAGQAPFFIGKRIFRSDYYCYLLERRERQASLAGRQWIADPAHFPGYRSE